MAVAPDCTDATDALGGIDATVVLDCVVLDVLAVCVNVIGVNVAFCLMRLLFFVFNVHALCEVLNVTGVPYVTYVIDVEMVLLLWMI